MVIYVGRLIVLTPAPLLVPAAITGLIVNPLWYIWLGLALRSPSQMRATVPAAGA